MSLARSVPDVGPAFDTGSPYFQPEMSAGLGGNESRFSLMSSRVSSAQPNRNATDSEAPTATDKVSVFEPMIKEKIETSPDPIQHQTMFVCILNTIKLAIGAGMLTLPWAHSNGYFYPSIIASIFSAIFSMVTASLVVYACEKSQCFEFTGLLHLVSPFWENAAVIILTYVCFSTCLGYSILTADFVTHGLSDVGFDGIPRWSWILMIGVTIFLPLSLIRDLHNLKYSSFFGLVSIFYTLGLVAFMAVNHDAHHTLATDTITYWGGSTGLFIVTNCCAKAYVIHYSLPQLYASLERRSVFRMNVVLVISYICVVAIYLTFGICGYLLYGNDVEADIINNLEGGVSTMFARVAMAISLCGTYPLVFRAMIKVLERKWFSSDTHPFWNFERSPKIRILTIVVLVSLAMFIALLTDDLGFVASIEGAVTVLGLVTLFPIVIIWSLGSTDSGHSYAPVESPMIVTVESSDDIEECTTQSTIEKSIGFTKSSFDWLRIGNGADLSMRMKGLLTVLLFTGVPLGILGCIFVK